MGKDWASLFLPPSLIFLSSIDRFVFRFMLLFHSILTFMKDLYQSENQVFNPTRLLVLLHFWVGKDWAGPFFPPPPKCLDLSIYCLVFRFMLLFHSILTFMKDLYQSENQVFNPTRLLVLLHCWLGKDWAGPFFPPPSIMLGSFNLLFSLSVYVTLRLYLNNFECPIPKRDQVFKPTS